MNKKKEELFKIYEDEILEARYFIEEHKLDNTYNSFMARMIPYFKNFLHSDIWSILYDFIEKEYKEYINSGVVTGLTYLVEWGEI